jgi:hypothetical protein
LADRGAYGVGDGVGQPGVVGAIRSDVDLELEHSTAHSSLQLLGRHGEGALGQRRRTRPTHRDALDAELRASDRDPHDTHAFPK